MYSNSQGRVYRWSSCLSALAFASAIWTLRVDAQAEGARTDGRLVLRAEWDGAGPRGPQLGLARGDTATFSASTLLIGRDFARLIKQRQGTSYIIVGMLLPGSLERLKVESARLVGRRVGVIVDGALVSLWRVEAPLRGRMLPIVTGANDTTASLVVQSLHVKK